MLQNQQAESLQPQPVLNIANDIQPIKTNISANVATSGKSIAPPVSLSRFPSVSNNAVKYNNGFSQSANIPYLMIIDSNTNNKPYSPILVDGVAD